MPRIRIYGTQNWRDNLSQPRYTPDQLEAQRLRNQAAQNRIDQFPLQQEARAAQLARAQGAEAKARYELQKEIETDRQKAAFYNGLQELESNLNAQGYGIGTKQHAEAFAAYAHAFPLARSSADVDKTLQLHAKVNDDQAALSQRIQTALGAVPEGYNAKDITMTASGEPSIRFSSDTPSTKAQERYAKLQGMIASHLEGSAAEKAANIAAGRSNVPYSKAIDFHATQTEIANLEQQFPGLKQPVDTPTVTPTLDSDEFGRTPENWQTQATPTSTPVPSVTPTADVVAPTATPKHLGKYNPDTGEFE